MASRAYDLIIVGGGLAGAALARVMAEDGHAVLVLERETRMKDRVRGELMWPWGTATPPTFDGTPGAIGKLATDYAKAIVLTAEAGSLAATASAGGVPNAAKFTAGMAILAPENDVEFLFGAVETDVPVLFDLFLYDDAGTKRFFKWSI